MQDLLQVWYEAEEKKHEAFRAYTVKLHEGFLQTGTSRQASYYARDARYAYDVACADATVAWERWRFMITIGAS